MNSAKFLRTAYFYRTPPAATSEFTESINLLQKSRGKTKKINLNIEFIFVRSFMSSFATAFRNRKPQLYSWRQFTFHKRQFPYGFVDYT